MDFKTKILEFLKKEEATLIRSWEWAKDARDRAPAASESHSDTTRSEQEKLVQALERDIKVLKGYIKEVERMDSLSSGVVGTWSHVELDIDGLEMKILVVPDGIGGKEINGVKLVSVATPLGKSLVGKTSGSSTVMNGRNIKVVTVK